MYRIMINVRKDETNKYGDLYKYLTEEINGETLPVEFKTLQSMDEYVQDLLNKGTYAKSDFIVVQVKEYNITTDLA